MNKTEQFIEKARKVHGNRYDYSKVVYINNCTKVIIICPEHGEFKQTPANHLSGQNCPKCSHRSYKKTTEEFVEEAKKMHGDKYDYSRVIYVKNNKNVRIICPEHGEFMQTPYKHLTGCGCPMCYNKIRGLTRKKTNDTFISELEEIFQGKNYDFSKVDYVNDKTKVIIICPEHGEFKQTPNHLLGRKTGCPKCSKILGNQKHIKTTDWFIEAARKVHGDLYDYSLSVYKGTKEPITIICKKHGSFQQKPNYHLAGNGCPKCSISKLEIELMQELEKNRIEYIFHYHPNFLAGLELDFYIPDVKLAIECQGIQHYSPVDFFGGDDGFEKTVLRDKAKRELCNINNVKLIFFTKERVNENETYLDVKQIINEIKRLKCNEE